MPTNKIIPTTISFLLTEESRDETGGKVSLLGFFSGDLVIVPESAEKGTLESIEIISILKDGRGEYKGKLQLLAPKGKNLLPADAAVTIKKYEGLNAIVKIRLRPFSINGFGDYVFKITIDSEPFEYTFKIIPPSKLTDEQREILDLRNVL